jgi:prepilin-type N-terminal cleavage/methylation domain-containing protein
MRPGHGYSLIEVMVATTLFGLVAAAVAQTIVVTQRSRQLGENWMRASQLAQQYLEAARAGSLADHEDGIFRTETKLTPVPGHPGLMRLDVTVSWTDGEPRSLELSTMVRR